MSSSCVPFSTTLPPEITTITSAFLIVVRRWAMMIVVRFSVASNFSIASWTTSSDSESRALVASSNYWNNRMVRPNLIIAVNTCECGSNIQTTLGLTEQEQLWIPYQHACNSNPCWCIRQKGCRVWLNVNDWAYLWGSVWLLFVDRLWLTFVFVHHSANRDSD